MSQPEPLVLGEYYHIYNRGNNRENLFVEARNYHYFMQLYARYIVPIARLRLLSAAQPLPSIGANPGNGSADESPCL